MKFDPASSRTAYREMRLVRGSSVLAGKVLRNVLMFLLFFKKKDRTTNDNGNKEEKKPGVRNNN